MEFMNIKEAAKILGYTVNTFYNMVQNDRCPVAYYRVGRLIRFRMQDIEEYLEQCRVEPKNAA